MAKSIVCIASFCLALLLAVPAYTQPTETNAMALAQQYFAQEEYEKALDQVDDLLDAYRSQPAYQLALDCYLALNDFKAAERLAERWAKKRPNQRHIHEVDLIFLYQQQQETDEVEELMETILERIRQNPSLAYMYGKQFSDRGFPKQALEVYLKAEEQNNRMNFDYQKALLYGELGDIQKMYTMYVALLERSGSYLNTVKILLTRALNNQGDDENITYLQELLVQKIQAGGPPVLNELLIHLFVEQENFSGAFTQLRALYSRNKVSMSEILRLARIAAKNEDYRLAQRIYDYVLDKDREGLLKGEATLGFLSAKRQILEADTTTQKKEWQDLAQAYESARQAFLGTNELAPLTQSLAEIYAYRLGKADTAEQLLRGLFTKGYLPKEAIAQSQIQLADLLLYRGNRWDAIIFYKKAEKDLEQSTLGQEAKFKRARAAYFVGDFDWAQSIFDVLKQSTSKTIANDAMRYALLIGDNMALDTNTAAMEAYAKADLYHYQGQEDSALFILERMLIGFPDHPILDETLLLQGDILYQKQNFSAAEQAWQTILEQHRDDILADDALNRLAALHLKVYGNKERAMELYQQLFTEFVDSFYASEARKTYRKLRGDTLN